MIDWMSSLLDNFGLIGLPYASLFLLIIGIFHRYRNHGQEISSYSSQFVESERHYWAVVPLHYGVLTVLVIHFLCWLLPLVMLWWTASGGRLLVLEGVAATAGLTALVGFGIGIARRWRSPALRRWTSPVDWCVRAVLGVQLVTGVLIAILHPWGTPWLAAAAAPYLRSVLLLNPDVATISNAPFLIKLHLANAFVLVALIPYTKLSHIVVLPISYLWTAPLAFRWRTKERHGGRI